MIHLKELLDDLDKISSDHEEINDTFVREELAKAIIRILTNNDYEVSDVEFGMFSEEGEKATQTALVKFQNNLVNSNFIYANSEGQALSIFQDSSVKSESGSTYDTYFGHADNGPVISKRWWKFW